MKFSLIISLSFGLISLASFAQSKNCSFSLSGKVLDADTKTPIPFATIKIKGENKFTTSNIDGEFTFKNLCVEDPTLIISCIGYCDSTCQHNHQHGSASHFYLTKKIEKLDEVVIEAEQLKKQGTVSMAQTTIEKKDMVIAPTQTLASAISAVDGVTFTSVGTNVQLPIIHGLYGNRVLILNNGMKHGFQNWSNDHAPEIDIASANKITVIKGASGVQFGPEALAGAIIVESSPLYLNEPLSLKWGSAYQTNGKGYSSNFELNRGHKKWSYFISGNGSIVGDRIAPNYVLTNSGKQEYALSSGLRFKHKNFDTKVLYSYVDQNLGFLRASIAEDPDQIIRTFNAEEPVIIRPFSYEINNPNQTISHHLAKAELGWWYSDHSKLTFKAGRQFNHRQEFDVRRNADWPIIDLELITTDFQLEWKHSEKFDLDGLIGVQYFEQENLNNPGTGTTAYIPNYISRRWSAFMIESKHFGKNIVELGLRLDAEQNYVAGRKRNQEVFYDDFSFRNLTASIGVVRDISDQLKFRSNLGSAWRTPNMAELYSFGQHGFKSSFGLLRYFINDIGRIRTNEVFEFSNSNVEVEKGFKWINELEINKEEQRHVLTGYVHYIENFIFDRPYAINQTLRGPMPFFIFDQADAFFTGIDYSWEMEMTKNISAKLGFSYLYSWNIEDNEPLINQPPIQLNYQLKVDRKKFWVFESSTFSIIPTYTFEQFQAPRTLTPEQVIFGEEVIDGESEIFDFADAPQSYFLLGLAWDFQWNQFSGGIRIENAFDTAYRDYLNEMRYFADEAGRNIIFNLTYTFKQKKIN